MKRSNLSRIYTQQKQNTNQTSNSQWAPHSSPVRARYGLSVVRNWRKLTALWRCRTALSHFQSPVGHCYESRYYMMLRVFLCCQVLESIMLSSYVLLCLVVTKEMQILGNKAVWKNYILIPLAHSNRGVVMVWKQMCSLLLTNTAFWYLHATCRT